QGAQAIGEGRRVDLDLARDAERLIEHSVARVAGDREPDVAHRSNRIEAVAIADHDYLAVGLSGHPEGEVVQACEVRRGDAAGTEAPIEASGGVEPREHEVRASQGVEGIAGDEEPAVG